MKSALVQVHHRLHLDISTADLVFVSKGCSASVTWQSPEMAYVIATYIYLLQLCCKTTASPSAPNIESDDACGAVFEEFTISPNVFINY